MVEKEFDVIKSDRIKANCVTNGNYSVVIKGENEAYMVCNMINRLIRNTNNEYEQLILKNEELNEHIEELNVSNHLMYSEMKGFMKKCKAIVDLTEYGELRK